MSRILVYTTPARATYFPLHRSWISSAGVVTPSRSERWAPRCQ
jgi:hypothetical protein